MVKLIKKRKNPKFMYSLFLFGLVGMLFYGALVLEDIYSRENNIKIVPFSTQDVKQGDSIILKFSTAVDGRMDLSNIRVEPRLKIQPLWVNNRELEIRIKEEPIMNQKYTVSINNLKTFWLSLRKDIVFNFESAKIPAVANVYPGNKQTEVSYDSNIKIDLARALSKQIILEIDINPDIEVEASLNKSRTTVEIVPKNNLAKAQKYELTINAKDKSKKGFSQNIYKGTFVTKIPPRVIYGFDKNGEPNKTEDLTWEISAKIVDGRYIDIDLTHQVMSIFEDGLRKGSYKVSSGKRGMNTPTGTFHILSKGRKPWSAKYGLYMPWYMGFTTKGHGIHELPEWPSGYKEGANHLGIPVSHGCVRLGVGPAKLIYDFTTKGTPVVVHY